MNRFLNPICWLLMVLLSYLFFPPALIFATQDFSYHFNKEPYINPKIIQELNTWMSDTGDQIVSINLTDSQNSNRFFADVKVDRIKDENPFVYVESDKEKFGYQYIGKTLSGVHVVYISDWSGGSGTFKSLMLINLDEDYGFSYDEKSAVLKADNRRQLIKKMGSIQLGDRYSGDIKLEGNQLLIGKDKGWFSSLLGIWKIIKIE